MKQRGFSDVLGLRLTRQALRALKERGIFAHSPVSLEQQHLAKRSNLDLSGKNKNKAGTVLPTFYSLAGEEVGIPKRFRPVVRAITKAVHCDGCFHCHYVRPPKKVEEQVYSVNRVTA